MSSSTPGQTATPSDFKSILDAALNEYKKKTGKELLDHPLATEVQGCDSVDAIKAILQGQAKAFQRFRDGDQRLMKWISPVVDVLYTLSSTLGEVAGMAFPPAGVVFTGIGILLAAAKDVRSSHDALVELFERIENLFKRLGVYTQISLTAEMAEVFVKIVAEMLSILSIATKEVKRNRAKIYFRKLLGRTDIEDALRKLDSLIQEEVRMAVAQIKNDTSQLKGGVEKSNDNIDEIKWNQIDRDVRKWFSPPDPSTNHNTACDVYHNAPPTWFFEAGVFKDWMSNGSLLWIHGKPGSGKSILCSAIIQHIMTLRDAGSASLAYFYFDFRDDQKQNVRDVVTSLLVQLSAYSKPCSDIIYRLYLTHGKGVQQPSNGTLVKHLKEMLIVAVQHPIFIIMDALDGCPDYGILTPREAVLNFVMDLVRLKIPNLHICVTSRLEFDIQAKLKPIAVNTISLHDENRRNIADYVSSVVSSDERVMKWRDEDKKLVVEQLSERADGMFQWVFCQLEMLRNAVQPDIRAILEMLPKTLDETYERALKGINENNRDHARRLLHCLAVSVRPLRVEELAEILTFDFDTTRGGIPKFHPDRRRKDQEEAVLSICSSLVTVVNNRGSRVVQFSHLSVKEFLTSDHLASSTGHLTSYHIHPGPAHTILAQVCLGFLLHLDDHNDNKGVKGSPLAEYAARHWVTHARFKGVASCIENGMRALFDPDRPHFALWRGLYDIDAESGGKLPSEIASPLYYSALCGFDDLVRHLAIKHPQYINAIGGTYGFPLVAALFRNHVPVAELLLKHGGIVDVRDTRKQTALHKTIDRYENVAINAVLFLLERGADVNARRDDLWTPLHLAVNTGELLVAQMLLDHRADVNSRNEDGQTPLHLLLRRQFSQDEDNCSDIAKLLLEHGANVKEKDKDNVTPLHLAIYNKRPEMVRVLLNRGANDDAENDQGDTPLQIVLRSNYYIQEDGIVRLFLEHDAEVYARDNYRISTSDLASCFGRDKVGQTLGIGTFFKAENNRDQTAFRLWIEECSVNGNIQDKYDTILLHSASYHGQPEMARILLNHGIKSNAKNHRGETALHVVSRGRYDSKDGVRVVLLLIQRGVDVNAQDNDRDSPLHSASYNGKLEIARVLLDHDAKVSAKNDRGETPLHQVSQGEYESQSDGVGIARLLLDRGVDVNVQDWNGATALHLASLCGKLEVARFFLEQATVKNDRVRTPLPVSSKLHPVDLKGETPLHLLSLHHHSQSLTLSSPPSPPLFPIHTSGGLRPFDARDAFANGTQPVIPVTRAAPQSTAGGSAHIPAVSVDSSAAPTTSAPPLSPVAFCTPSRLLTPSKHPDRSGGCESGGDGAIKPASTWWGFPKRKRTIPVEQTEIYTHTRSRAVEAIGGALGMAACIGHELLFVGVDLLQLIPVPGLELAGKILLNIWDAVEIVETNRIASLRLTERCADVLISIRGEIVNAGYTVAEELRAPIARLVEAFGEVHHFLENLGQRPFLKHYLRRDEILSSITACDTSLNNALGMFSFSIQIRTLKLIQANELQRQKETHDLLQSVSHLSPGLPPMPLPMPPATLLSSHVDPESVRKTLHALRAAQNAQDRARDMADLRQLMQTALATNDDVAMIEVLQIARSEMPEAIKTLQRALQRVVDDVQLDAESATARLLPLSPQQDARKGTGPSVDPGSTGASRHSTDALDREFIETGIGALRRLSKGTDLFLPSWTITWYEIDLEAKVGIGFFSDVYRGTWLKRTVAVKVLAETTPRKIFVHEVEIWKSLYHPNVLELFGASSASGEPPWFLVSKYYPRGSLVKYLKGLSDADATRVDALKMIHEISNGMEYLHNRGVLHGDLKAANILVDNDVRCVISDFGQSEMKSEVYRISRVSQPRGTLRWQAPELMQGAQALTSEMDVYAFAICCVEILTMGALPWPLMDDDAVRHFVLNENMKPSLPPSNLVNGQLMNVIRASWDTVPSNRPSFKQTARELRKQRAENID